MKQLIHYLKLIAPALLVIFILGGKPAKVGAQETEKEKKHAICLKVVTEEDGKKVVIDTSFAFEGIENLDDMIYAYDVAECGDGKVILTIKKGKNGQSYIYCYSSDMEKDLSKAIVKAGVKTVYMKDGVYAISTDEDGEVRLILKSKGEGDADSDIYIIKTTSSEKEKKKKDNDNDTDQDQDRD